MKHLKYLLLATSCALAVPAMAEKADGPWQGEFDLGVSKKTGNTESTDAAAKFRLRYTQDGWRHALRLEASRESESGEKTAERYLGQFQSNYDFTERDYAFGVLRAERDEFSGYKYQTSLAAGYGRHLWISERGTLNVEAGPGVRRSKLDSGDAETEFVGRFFGGLNLNLSDNAQFSQEVTVITGSENTETESISAITAAINKALALRLSFTVKHNSTVPAEIKKTDTTTNASVVYRF